jgi:hypothetical protein
MRMSQGFLVIIGLMAVGLMATPTFAVQEKPKTAIVKAVGWTA